MKKFTAACPIDCRYCAITEVPYRRDAWQARSLIGLNKAATIINPPFDRSDKEALEAFYNFPLRLLEGDIVGFNAITDPMWPLYRQELEWFLEYVAPEVKAAVCVTKFPVSRPLMKELAKVPNFLLNVSITGLDAIEKSSTASRLKTLQIAKEEGVKAFPVIHPYISAMSNLSFLPELKKIGYDCVDLKGLRFDASMSAWMPEATTRLYAPNADGEFLPEDGWRQQIEQAGLTLRSLKSWQQENARTNPSLTHEDAAQRVRELIQWANITSSDSNDAVIKSSIERRCGIGCFH